MLLYREEPWRYPQFTDAGGVVRVQPYYQLLDMHIAKQRQGPVGMLALNYDQGIGRFAEWTGAEPPR